MNRKLFSIKLLTLILMSIFFITSCKLGSDEDEIDPISSYEYLIRYKEVLNVPTSSYGLYYKTMESKLSGTNFLLSDKVEHDVKIYKVSYKTKYNDKTITVSGLVSVPQVGNSTELPVISFQNGSNAEYAKAPSNNYTDPEHIFYPIAGLASLGYVVLIPDYIGFGDSEDKTHPYFDKVPTVQSLKDMLGALQDMAIADNLDLMLSEDLFLLGYSQGAWATMALLNDLENDTRLGFKVKSTEAGGGVYDLSVLMNQVVNLENYPMPSFLAYLFYSYIELGKVNLKYEDVFTSAYAGKIKGMFDGKKSLDSITSLLTTRIADLFNEDFRTNYSTGIKYAPLITALKTNSVPAWNSSTTINLYHGGGDNFVAYEHSEDMVAAMEEKSPSNQNIKLVSLPGFDHKEATIPFALEAIKSVLAHSTPTP